MPPRSCGRMGIGQSRAFEGHARVGILLEIDQHIAVGKPCEMVMRRFLQHPPHFLPRLRGTSITPIGARQIHPRGREIGDTAEHRLERRDALGDLVLIQQGGAQEPEAIRISGVLSIRACEVRARRWRHGRRAALRALGEGSRRRGGSCVGRQV